MEQRTSIPRPPSFDEYNLNATLESAQDELVKLVGERESIDRRISKLQKDIFHLAALCNVDVEDPVAQLGLTDAVRWIFVRDKKPLNVDEIVEALEGSYRDVSGYRNLPANIHTIVRRLAKANEIKPEAESGGVLGKIGGVKYIWNGGLGPPPPPQSWLKERLKKSQESPALSANSGRD